MKIKETAEGLEVKHIPGCIWFLGIGFIVVALTFIYGFFGGFSNYDEIETWEFYVGLMVAVAVLIGGIYVITNHPAIITKINGRDKRITIVKKNILKKEESAYRFADVSGFDLIEEKDSDNDSFFYIYLKTNRGEKIKINSNGIQVKDYALEIKDVLDRYLQKEKLLDK